VVAGLRHSHANIIVDYNVNALPAFTPCLFEAPSLEGGYQGSQSGKRCTRKSFKLELPSENFEKLCHFLSATFDHGLSGVFFQEYDTHSEMIDLTNR
jgi:hypothetical protein